MLSKKGSAIKGLTDEASSIPQKNEIRPGYVHRTLGDGFISFAGLRRSVGAAGFEPTTFCSQSRRATGLRHAPFANAERRATKGRRAAPADDQVRVMACASWRTSSSDTIFCLKRY